MENLNIIIQVSSELYNKNPDSSKLGKSIVTNSIELINEIGFEAFTFKKLGVVLNSPESSIYRYFKNKHILLVYLTSWYWSWMEYKIVFATSNMESSKDKLFKAIDILTQPVLIDNSISYINEILLNEIIISESMKSYQTKNVDEENKKGYFKSYKSVVQRVSGMILEIKPKFEFSHMLVTTVIEGVHHQRYFADHLPALTDCSKGKNNITKFYTELILKFIQ